MNNLKWFLNRLSSMSFEEILYRIYSELKKRITIAPFSAKTPLKNLKSISGYERRELNWYLDLSNRDQVKKYVVEHFNWNEEQALLFLDHKFSFFSFDNYDFGSYIKWNYDYLNRVEFPLEYGITIDYKNNIMHCGDIKYAWEHNRHQHLVEIAKAYYLTGNDIYAKEVTNQINSWIDASPYPFGINWASPLECAIRIINWCFCFEYLLKSGFLKNNNGFKRRWIASFYEHLRFISKNPSKFSSANNHLIGEASGLFIGSLYFSFTESEEWLISSKEILEKECIIQNYSDGVNKEQAISYQSFIYDFLVLPALLGEINGIKFSDIYWKRLERMAEFVNALIDSSGTVPKIGDEDDGCVIILSHEEEFKPFRSLLAIAASVFKRKDFKNNALKFDEKSFWLLGFKGINDFNIADKTEEEKLSFNEGGYYILKNINSKLIFDCGPLGYLSIAAHGHADALSFILEYKYKYFFIDPGTYAYHTNKKWRDYFRGTSAHNTIRIDGEDQSVITGNFMWRYKAESHLIYRDNLSLCGWHNGYQRLKDPVIHERDIKYVDCQYIVTDRIKSKGKHRVEQFFHLSPDCNCKNNDNIILIANSETAIKLVPDGRVSRSRIYKGSTEPIAGWYSPGFDVKIPTNSICFETFIEGTIELITRIIF